MAALSLGAVGAGLKRRHAGAPAALLVAVERVAVPAAASSPAARVRWSSSLPFPKMPHSKAKLEVKRACCGAGASWGPAGGGGGGGGGGKDDGDESPGEGVS